jgi:hypothetical protein
MNTSSNYDVIIAGEGRRRQRGDSSRHRGARVLLAEQKISSSEVMR